MTDDPEKPDPKKAAWKGYADYRREMEQRRTEVFSKRLTLGTMLRIAAVLLAVLLIADAMKLLD